MCVIAQRRSRDLAPSLPCDTVKVDAQHTMKVARLLAKEGNRVRKKDSPHFMRGETLLNFLDLKVTPVLPPLCMLPSFPSACSPSLLLTPRSPGKGMDYAAFRGHPVLG